MVEPIEILKRPYARVLTPEPDGQVTAEIMEFPGCVAFGDNSVDALAKLESVAADWIAASLEQGQDIPEPMSSVDHSGRTVLRMTKGLHKRAAICADREGVSLNQFIVTCLAECVGERSKPQVVYPTQFNVSATMTFQIIGANTGSLPGIVQSGGTKELVAGTAGGAVLPIPRWRELERETCLR